MDKREVQRQIDRIAELKSRALVPTELRPWRAQTERVLADIFRPDSLQVKQFKEIAFEPSVVPLGAPQEFFDNFYRRALSEAEALLRTFVEDLSVLRDSQGIDLELTCPHCHSKNPELVEFRNIGTVEVQGGIPILRGRKENVESVAYYRCRVCNRPFYIEATKGESQTRTGVGRYASEGIFIPTIDMEQQQYLKKSRPQLWDFLNAIPVITTERDYQRFRTRMELMMAEYDLTHHVDEWNAFDERSRVEGIAHAILLSKKQIVRRSRWRFWE